MPVSDFSEVVAVLQDSVTNGIHKEDEILSCPEVVRKSIVEAEDGSIRFKTEGSKGKKPTLFANSEDFAGAVEFLASIQEMIAKKPKP